MSATETAIGALADKLATIVGREACLTDGHDIEPYAVDWRGAFQANPAAVVKPASTEEVSAVMRFAADENLAVVPAGGRTGLPECSTTRCPRAASSRDASGKARWI